jgi:hypothetical protein
VLGTVGGLAGGFAGPMVGPQALLRLASAGGGKGGMLSSVLGKIFPEAAAGLEGAAAKPLSEEASKIAADKLALETRKLAARESALEIAKERNALMRMRLEGKAVATPRVPRAPTVSPETSAPTLSPDATQPVAVTPPGPAAAADAGPEGVSTIVLKLQQQMGTAGGRRVVRELLAQMPKEQAAMIKGLLAKGQEHPATVLGALFDPTKSAVGAVARPGEELARLLGQIP